MFMLSESSLAQLATAALFILSGLIIGLITEKLLLTKLTRIAERTTWEGDDIIIAALKGLVMPLIVLGGIYGSVIYFPLEQTLEHTIVSFISAAAIIIVTFITSKTTVGFVKLYSNKLSQVLPSSSIFVNIARISVIVIGGLIALQTIGISITPLITALGVGGLAVALAFQDTLSNLFSGLQIIISQQMKPGDYVRLDDGLEGIVEDVTWRNTTIKSLTNNQIIVPNSKLATSVITNYSKPVQEIVITVGIGVDYASDLAKVEKITVEVATTILKTIPGGVPDFSPLVRFHTFGSSSIDANVILRVKNFADQGLIKHEFIKAIHERFNKENINIPFPTQTILLKQ